jgi:phosphate starvation-inducible PhoH-like protein
MGDVQLGDKIIGSDGRPHNVIGVYPQGELDVYRVTFSDGSSVECSEDHLWQVRSTNHRFRGQPGVVLALKEFMHDLRMPNGNHRWYIPMVQPIEFGAQTLPVDPYLLGVLLGDGCLRHRISFSSADAEIVQSVTALTNRMGLIVRDKGRYDHVIVGVA